MSSKWTRTPGGYWQLSLPGWDLTIWDSDAGGWYWKALKLASWRSPIAGYSDPHRIDGWEATLERAQACAIAATVV